MDAYNCYTFAFLLVISDDVIIHASASNLNTALQYSSFECVLVFRSLFKIGNSLRNLLHLYCFFINLVDVTFLEDGPYFEAEIYGMSERKMTYLLEV
jgi:hypothetical protein